MNTTTTDTTCQPTLKDRIAELHQARLCLKGARDARQEAEAEFKAENTDLYQAEDDAVLEVSGLEAGLRAAALEEFSRTGEKKPADGVEVKVFKVYDYPAGTALQWAIGHKLCLSLDTRAFDQLCKNSSTRPPFVTEKEEGRAQIATDLTKIILTAEVE